MLEICLHIKNIPNYHWHRSEVKMGSVIDNATANHVRRLHLNFMIFDKISSCHRHECLHVVPSW